MTGRELILYILENHLEDESVVNPNGTPVGFASVEEAAVMLNVGVPTVYGLIAEKKVAEVRIGYTSFIPIVSLVKWSKYLHSKGENNSNE